MHKPDLIKKVSQATGQTLLATEAIINALLEEIQEGLVNGEKVTMVGFGTFTPRTSKARKGRHPSTGAVLDIPARKGLRFKAGKTLKDAVANS